jgi:hypothetical protein
MYVNNGGQVLLGVGTITIGNGSTFTEPGDGSFSNVLIIGNGGLFAADAFNDQTRNMFIGTAKNQQSTYNLASNNVVRVLPGGVLRGFSQLTVTTNNLLDVEGGMIGGTVSTNVFKTAGSVSNSTGTVEAWGFFNCSTKFDNTNGTFYTRNSAGSLVCSDEVYIASNNFVQVELGSSPSATFPTICVSNLTVRGAGTLNIVAPGSFGDGTYVLFTNLCSTCTTQVDFEGWTLGSVPNPSATYTVSVSTNVSGGGTNAILLTVSGLSQPLPFQITSIVRTNSGVDGNNDVLIKWNTTGTNNHVLAGYESANGSYSATNAFTSLASIAVTTTATNYLDVGGATNRPTRYYRISSP